jgi:hypothetical protein
MSTLKRAVLTGGMFLAALSLASVAKAGDVKGKVAVQGLKSPETLLCTWMPYPERSLIPRRST